MKWQFNNKNSLIYFIRMLWRVCRNREMHTRYGWEKLKERDHLKKSRQRWDYYTKMGLNETRCQSEDCIHLAQDMDRMTAITVGWRRLNQEELRQITLRCWNRGGWDWWDMEHLWGKWEFHIKYLSENLKSIYHLRGLGETGRLDPNEEWRNAVWKCELDFLGSGYGPVEGCRSQGNGRSE